MVCTNCGKEMQKGWKICPNCGIKPEETEENMNSMAKEYHFIGIRRNGKSEDAGGEDGGQKIGIHTNVKLEGNKIKVFKPGKPSSEKQFCKNDVESIDLPLLPIWKASDFFRLAVFGVLMLITYGLSIFAVLYSIRIMISRHIRIKLHSGMVIKIPICQKADASEFLKELDYSPTEIEKNNLKKIEQQKWLKREATLTKIMFSIVAATMSFGFYLREQSMHNQKDEQVMQENIDETLDFSEQSNSSEDNSSVEENISMEEYLNNCEEVTGEQLARNAEEYIGKDIKMEGKFNILAGSIVLDWFTDSGIIKIVYDGKAVDSQGNVIGNVMSGDYGYVAGRYGGEDIGGTPYIEAVIIVLEDGEDKTGEKGGEPDGEVLDNEVSDNQEYIFADSGNRYLSEEEVRSVGVDKLRIARNEIFARHGYIFNDEELRQYFSNMSWYKGSVPSEEFNMDVVFNDFEKKNIELIEGLESEVNNIGDEQDSDGFIIPSGTYVNNELFEGHQALMKLIYYEGDEVGVEFLTEPRLNGINLYGFKIDDRTIQVAEEYEGIIVTLTWDSETEVTAVSSGEFTGMDSRLFDDMTNAKYSLIQ